MTVSSRGRPSLRSTGHVALGLEDEVEFGSDEDLLETVGEIQMDDVGWYPAYNPDGKGNIKPGADSKDTFKRKSRFMGRKSDRSIGLGDAKILLMDEMASPKVDDLSRAETGKRSQASGKSGRDSVSFDEGASTLWSDAGSMRIVKRDGTVKKTMFNKLFSKKDRPMNSQINKSTGAIEHIAQPSRE